MFTLHQRTDHVPTAKQNSTYSKVNVCHRTTNHLAFNLYSSNVRNGIGKVKQDCPMSLEYSCNLYNIIWSLPCGPANLIFIYYTSLPTALWHLLGPWSSKFRRDQDLDMLVLVVDELLEALGDGVFERDATGDHLFVALELSCLGSRWCVGCQWRRAFSHAEREREREREEDEE